MIRPRRRMPVQRPNLLGKGNCMPQIQKNKESYSRTARQCRMCEDPVLVESVLKAYNQLPQGLSQSAIVRQIIRAFPEKIGEFVVIDILKNLESQGKIRLPEKTAAGGKRQKITGQTTDAIKKAYLASNMTQKDLAAKFGVSIQTVQKIIRGI